MKHKALVRRLQISCLGLDPIDPLRLLVDDVVEALRENAMREVQRLGQKIEQEPVKYSDYEPDGVHHTTPPQRTWVGLTDEEIEQIGLSNYIKVVRETEAKLKERNT